MKTEARPQRLLIFHFDFYILHFSLHGKPSPGANGLGGRIFSTGELAYSAEKAKTVVCLYGWFGFTMIDGNVGWLTESGKCCVSRQTALRGA